MPALAFYIDAPMQAWGLSSRFQHRETNAFPTKSALVGMVAAAMGINKHDADEYEHLSPLVDLRLTVVRLPKPNPRVDVSRLSDFHTVGGGYDKNRSLREKMSIPKKASGAPFGTVITHRSYLTDASFAAIFEGGTETLERVHAALLNPVWGIWFGRKTCLPASPLTPTLGDDRQAAFDGLLAVLPDREPTALETCDYQEEAEDGVFFQSDQPVAYGAHHGSVPAPYRARGLRQHRFPAS